MGVSASGKSSVGRALAGRLDVAFLDADDLHPQANVAKMAAGEPLDDDDRRPWLDAVGEAIAARDGVVMACSALKRSYRDSIRRHAPDTVFVLLHGSTRLLTERATGRTDHFMPPSLLASQLATLEPLEDDERGTVVDVAPPVDEIAETAAVFVRDVARTVEGNEGAAAHRAHSSDGGDLGGHDAG